MPTNHRSVIVAAVVAACLPAVASAASMGAYYELKRLAKEFGPLEPPAVGPARELAKPTPRLRAADPEREVAEPAPRLRAAGPEPEVAEPAPTSSAGPRFRVSLRPASPHLLSFVRVIPPQRGVVGPGEAIRFRVWQKNNWQGGEYVLDLSCTVAPAEGSATARLSCGADCSAGNTYAGGRWERCGASLENGRAGSTIAVGKESTIETWASAYYDTWRSNPGETRVHAKLRLLVDFE